MNPPSFHIATEHSAQHLPFFILIIKFYRWTDRAVNPLAYTAGCETVWAIDVFRF